MELVQPVHAPWIEVTPTEDITWEPLPPDRYRGTLGGGDPGPTSWMHQVVRRADSLECIFLDMVPWTFFVVVAKRSHKYAYEDWVVENNGNDRDRSEKNKRYLESCTEDTPGSRHHSDNKKRKYEITPVLSPCLYFRAVTLEAIKDLGGVCGDPLRMAYLFRTSET